MLTSWANDGDVVSLTWDETAGSVSVRWSHGAIERMTLERETASKVSVREALGRVELRVWSRPERFTGELLVSVGEHVSVSDALLRA